MQFRHALFKSLSRSPVVPIGKQAPTRRPSTLPRSVRPRRPGLQPLQQATKSAFEGVTIPADFLGPEKVIIPVSASFTCGRLRHRHRPRHSVVPKFLIKSKTIREIEPITPAGLAARAYTVKMLSWVQIITTPTADTPGTCLLLHFDNKRYVFGNISEGTQRVMMQRKVSLSNLMEDMFISGPINWKNAGGLIGMVLTAADTISQTHVSQKDSQEQQQSKRKQAQSKDVAKLVMHGGKNLAQVLATSRRFVFRQGLPLYPDEIRIDPRPAKNGACKSDPDWQDTNIKVWYLPLDSSDQKAVKSLRKRSHDEMSSSDDESHGKQASNPTDEDQAQVQNIVKQMFNSDWRLDALVETTLHRAKLPAKLFIRDKHGHLQVYQGPLPGQAEDVPDIPVLTRLPWPAAMFTSLPATEPSRQSLCYFVKIHDRRGKFLPQEAEKYGVAKTDYKKLAMGESVKGKDDISVTPQMVLGPEVPGQGFAVLDVPDKSYVQSLIERPEWSNAEITKGIVVIFWLLGPDVLQDSRLQSFMEKKSSIKHIVCSGDTAPNMITLESVAAQTYNLHCIDPVRFPIPFYQNEVALSGKRLGELTGNVEPGRTGKMIQFSPQFIHKDDMVVPFPDLQKIAQAKRPEEFLENARAADQRCRNPEFLENIEKVESDLPNRDAEIITLGTGSALPSKYRNVSATLVRVPGVGNYLFDCGENTLGQLRRVFGKELPSILRDLKVIWISHLHADHHLGTASVIKAWHNETCDTDPSARLLVGSHNHMIDWIREYAEIEDIGLERLVLTTFNTPPGASGKVCRPRIFNETEQEAFGLTRIDACFVSHCFGALATVFTWPSGLKIAWSGDCRPSDAFVKIGQGTTLLIHEATFDDALEGDAKAKKHSTTSEAIDVGRRMGARRMLLTHFSQRYQKIPLVEENLEVKPDVADHDKPKFDEVILVAFDYMRVKLGDFRKAQAYLPAIQKLFEGAGEHQ